MFVHSFFVTSSSGFRLFFEIISRTRFHGNEKWVACLLINLNSSSLGTVLLCCYPVIHINNGVQWHFKPSYASINGLGVQEYYKFNVWLGIQVGICHKSGRNASRWVLPNAGPIQNLGVPGKVNMSHNMISFNVFAKMSCRDTKFIWICSIKIVLWTQTMIIACKYNLIIVD